MEAGTRIAVGGPYFEDLRRGEVFEAPSLTLTWGHAAIHQAACGDSMHLPLDSPLSREVTGESAALVHPNLVCDVAIGQLDGPDPTRPREPLLPRPGPHAPGVSRRHASHDDRGGRAQAESDAARRLGLGPRGAPHQDGEPAGRAGARLLPLPDDPLRDTASTGSGRFVRRHLAELDRSQGRRGGPDWDYGSLRERMEAGVSVEVGAVYEIEGRDTVSAHRSSPG